METGLSETKQAYVLIFSSITLMMQVVCIKLIEYVEKIILLYTIFWYICRKVEAVERWCFFQANIIAHPVFEGHDQVYLKTVDSHLEYVTKILT